MAQPGIASIETTSRFREKKDGIGGRVEVLSVAR